MICINAGHDEKNTTQSYKICSRNDSIAKEHLITVFWTLCERSSDTSEYVNDR